MQYPSSVSISTPVFAAPAFFAITFKLSIYSSTVIMFILNNDYKNHRKRRIHRNILIYITLENSATSAYSAVKTHSRIPPIIGIKNTAAPANANITTPVDTAISTASTPANTVFTLIPLSSLAVLSSRSSRSVGSPTWG